MAERLMSDGTDYIDTEHRPTPTVVRSPGLDQYNAQMAEYRRQRAAVEAGGGDPNTVKRPTFSQGVLFRTGEEEARLAAQRTARAGGVVGTQEDNLAAFKEAFGMKKTRMLLDKLPEGEEPHIVEIPEGGYLIEAAIPKSAEGKIKWMRKVLSDIEEQDADTQGDPTVTQRRDSMLKVIGYLMSDRYKEEELIKHKPIGSRLLTYKADLEDYNANLKIGKMMHDELNARIAFHQEFLAFSGKANKAEDVFGYVKEISGDQLNTLFHIPSFVHALNYYEQYGETFSDQASTIRINEKGDGCVSGYADEEGNLYDDPGEAGKGRTLVDTADKAHDAFRKRLKAALEEESGIAREDIEWAANLAERFWRISGRRATQMKVIQNQNGEYVFLDSVNKGDDVYRRLLRVKEFVLSNKERDNLRVIWDPLMDGVDLQERDYIEDLITSVDDIKKATGVDISSAIDPQTGKINFVKVLELEEAQKRVRGEEEKDPLDFGKFGSTEVWGIRKIKSPDDAKEVLMKYLRKPNSQSLIDLKDVFNYQKDGQYRAKGQLLENFARFLRNARDNQLRELGLVKPDRAATDTIVSRVSSDLGLTVEEATERARNVLGRRLTDQLLLLNDYFPADEALLAFLWGLVKGFLAEIAKTR